MSKIDVIKKNLQFQELVKESGVNSILKEEYLIPDTHPDVQEILLIEANPIISSKEVISDKIMIEGKMEYNVIYIPREDNMVVNSVSYSEKFTNYLDVNNDEHKIICEVDCKLEHIDAKVMNERKIEIESSVKIVYEIYKGTEFEFVEDIAGSVDVQIQKKTDTINRLATSMEVELLSKSMIRVSMDKPEIDKILKCSMMLHKREIKIGEDKIYLACYCRVSILYIAKDSEEIYHLEDDIYISKDEDSEGLISNMIPSVVYEIENKDISLEEDDLGETRIVNLECLVKAVIKIFSNEDIEAVDDAYSAEFLLELKSEEFSLGVVEGIQSIESTIKDNFPLKEGDKIPGAIISSIGNIMVSDKRITQNKLTVEGVINVKVIYESKGEKQSPSKMEGEIPFTSVLDISGITEGMKAIAKCNIEDIYASVEANTIGVKAIISIEAKIYSKVNKTFISDIIEVEGEVEDKKASVTIYVVSKGDTLWKIAKKYNTTVDEIIGINDIEEPEMLKVSEKLLIPGRAKF